MVLSGICDLILAAIIVYSWPVSAGWMLGLLVGVSLVTTGLAVIITAIEARNFAQSFLRATS